MPLQHTTIAIDDQIAQYSKPNSVEDILESPQVEATREGWKRNVLAGSKPKKAHNQYILYMMFTNGSSVARQHYWKYVATPKEKTLFKDACLILADERKVEANKISLTASSSTSSKLRKAPRKSRALRPDNQTARNISSPTRSLVHALDAAILANSSSNVLTNYASLLDPSTNLSSAHIGSTMIPDGPVAFMPPSEQNLPTVAAQWYHGGGQSIFGNFLQSQSYGVCPKCSQDYRYPHGSGNNNPLASSSLAASYASPRTPNTGQHKAYPSLPDFAFIPGPHPDSDLALNDFGFLSPTGCFDDDFDYAITSSRGSQTGSYEAGLYW